MSVTASVLCSGARCRRGGLLHTPALRGCRQGRREAAPERDAQAHPGRALAPHFVQRGVQRGALLRGQLRQRLHRALRAGAERGHACARRRPCSPGFAPQERPEWGGGNEAVTAAQSSQAQGDAARRPRAARPSGRPAPATQPTRARRADAQGRAPNSACRSARGTSGSQRSSTGAQGRAPNSACRSAGGTPGSQRSSASQPFSSRYTPSSSSRSAVRPPSARGSGPLDAGSASARCSGSRRGYSSGSMRATGSVPRRASHAARSSGRDDALRAGVKGKTQRSWRRPPEQPASNGAGRRAMQRRRVRGRAATARAQPALAPAWRGRARA